MMGMRRMSFISMMAIRCSLVKNSTENNTNSRSRDQKHKHNHKCNNRWTWRPSTFLLNGRPRRWSAFALALKSHNILFVLKLKLFKRGIQLGILHFVDCSA